MREGSNTSTLWNVILGRYWRRLRGGRKTLLAWKLLDISTAPSLLEKREFKPANGEKEYYSKKYQVCHTIAAGLEKISLFQLTP
jgi:hypothetical protein